MADAVVIDPSLAMRWMLHMPLSTEATTLLQRWLEQEIDLLAPRLFIGELRIARETGRTSALDAMYAALAEREGCELWTADKRFWNGVKTRYPWVRCIAEPALGLTTMP